MSLPPPLISELKQIMQEEFDLALSFDEAEDMADTLTTIFQALCQAKKESGIL